MHNDSFNRAIPQSILHFETPTILNTNLPLQAMCRGDNYYLILSSNLSPGSDYFTVSGDEH